MMASTVQYHEPSTLPSFSHGTAPPELNFTVDEFGCPVGKAQSPIIFYSVFFAVFYLGIVGNMLLVLIFVRHRSMRTGPNTFILNLSLFDLGTVLSCAVAPLLDNAGPSHPILCRLLRAVMEACMGGSSFTLVALSAERYFAISRPLQARIKVSRTRPVFWTILFIWLTVGSFALGKQILLTPHKCAKCLQMYDPNDFDNTYTILDFALLYMGPLVVIACFYIMMAKKLYFSGMMFRDRSNTNTTITNHLQVRKRVAWTVLALVVMFALFYLPFNLMSLMLYFDKASTKVHAWAPMKSILYCIGCLHNSFNPVILYCLSKSYRGHFNNYLCVFASTTHVKEEDTQCRCEECCKHPSPHNSADAKI